MTSTSRPDHDSEMCISFASLFGGCAFCSVAPRLGVFCICAIDGWKSSVNTWNPMETLNLLCVLWKEL